ncbi:hypothetical protein F0562_020961 [Nyssa sinensis]|uniref:PRONE domain-containing protein n=1 Tax=Nyssa sinensis TaxID=561372 RepID=A0A5J5BT39_9ASTE|nr:hypothetical protein F0562_020961 [Nyssa sinensis]
MGSISSEDGFDQQSERCGSYSLSADVSESESSSSFSCRRYDAEGASSSIASSPLARRPMIGNSGFTLVPPPPLMLPVIGGKDVVTWEEKPEKRRVDLSEVEMMKERFAKLLLGEDMSGGGKGVCTALAISNSITNLSATVFGELWRLEPLAPQKKAMWRREMEWLLYVSDSIVELVPSIQQFPGGGTYEIMATRPRSDLYMNLPALKKLDAMLISILDGFCDMEFWKISGGSHTQNFLPKDCQRMQGRRLQQCRDCTNQILKAAMAINSSLLAEMEIPSAYVETLPKSGKACLGDVIYHHITADKFSPECLLDCLDLSSEHHTLEVANVIEAAVHVWKQKDRKKHINHLKTKRSSWGGKVKNLVADGEKYQFLAQRADILLQSLRLRFPGLPQTALDMNKIQYNKDVGQSILESYSRVMESLAFNIMARIDDVLYVDDAIKRCAAAESVSIFSRGGLGGLPIQKRMSPSTFSVQHTPYTSPFATPTLCSSPPKAGSPCKDSQLNKNSINHKLEKPIPADLERVWSYAGNLGARKISGDAPERD